VVIKILNSESEVFLPGEITSSYFRSCLGLSEKKTWVPFLEQRGGGREEGGRMEEGGGGKEEGRGEGRGKREEGREEGRGKREEGGGRREKKMYARNPCWGEPLVNIF
jgi:hypothetical protein